MKRNYSWILLALASSLALGQSTATSPYTSFGVGELLFDNNVEQAGMGGISAINVNPYQSSANFYNPAANQNLTFTSFEFSVNNRLSKFSDVNTNSQKSSTYISNVSLAFPIGQKVRAGFGFQPYTAMGYDVQTVTKNETVGYANSFKGEGGLNSFHLMGSYNFNNNLSVGLRGNYIFGEIEKSQIITTENVSLMTDYNYHAKIHGFQFTLGSTYSKKLSDDTRLDVGATYTLGSDLRAKVTDMTTTFTQLSTTPGNIDTIKFNRNYGNLAMPQSFTLAASYKKDLKYLIGAQVDWGNWANYEMDADPSSMFQDRMKISVGGFWIPDFNSYKSYFERVVYRFGTYYETTPLKIDEQSLNRYGLTIGFGLPIGKDRDASMLNVAFDLGQYGKAENRIIKENYANIKVGFTLNDIWFRKRLID